jgi:DNA-nicking Smr family endonuclease
MTRRRQLSDEERALWTGFARSIAPLRQSGVSAKPSAEASAKSSATSSATPSATPAAGSGPAPSHAQPGPIAPRETPLSVRSPPLAPLGRRLKQRVARGREPIDARIDLHGLTQRQAHAALLRFLHRAQADGAKTVLVVTGKGSGKVSNIGERDAAIERGVLRRQVPLWLALPEFRPLIVGFDDAHIGHGGQGALYVRLRRRR